MGTPAAVPAPGSATLPTIKPPQPSGLMPAVGTPRNTITTQPMVMTRPGVGAPTAPPQPASTTNRSTQRLVVTPNAAAKMTSTRPLPGAPSAATINLPAGMILRCLPPEMLASDLAQFESSGTAATEVALPMNTLLNQLPSGKIELPVQDIVAQFPPGFLKSAAEIAPYLGTLVSLPLMDVVMRIPPDLLSVRPDQKDPTAAARHMADPFTEDSLRQTGRAPGQARIVDESQVAPAEEFVPQAAAAAKSFVPPPRNATAPLPLLHQTTSLSGRPATPLRSTAPMPGRILPPPVVPTGEIPMPRAPQLSASQMLGVPRPSPVVAPPPVDSTAGAPPVPQIPPPFAGTPPTPLAPISPVAAAPSIPSMPPVPAPPTVASSFAATIPMARPNVPAAPTIPASPAAPESPASPAVVPRPPDAGADELKRLAALAMAQEVDANPSGSKTDALAALPAVPELAKETPPAPGSVGADKTFLLPPPPAKVEPGFAATSRFGLPDAPARLSETTPVMPAPSASAPKDTGRLPGRPELTPRSITTRVTPPPVPAPVEAPADSPAASAATAVNLNNCSADDLLPIPGINRELAVAIVQHRDKIGEFHRLEELLDVPGMTRAAYGNLTGETPASGIHPSVNDLLGFPLDRELSLKDVTDRIACWPDVTGVLLSQKNGLPLVGTSPDFLDRQAIVAFAPRIFEDINKSFGEITGRQTDELIIPTTGTSFHLMRDKDLYLIILSRVPQMPDRHLKIARMVLAELSVRPS